MSLLFSCEKQIPYKGPTPPPQLVLNSAFTADSSWKVKLSKTLGITDTSSGRITNAHIHISSLDHAWTEPMSLVGDSVYVLTTPKAKYGERFTIEVNHPDFSLIQATDSVPLSPEFSIIDTLSTNVDLTQLQGIPALRIQLEMVGQPQTEYYMIEAETQQINFEGDTVFLPQPMFETDPLIINNQFRAFLDFYDQLFVEKTNANLDTFQLTFFVVYLYPETGIESLIRLRIQALSPDLYAYRKSFVQYSINYLNADFPQNQKVHSNIEGGLGIFGGYAEQEILIKY